MYARAEYKEINEKGSRRLVFTFLLRAITNQMMACTITKLWTGSSIAEAAETRRKYVLINGS